MCRCHRARVPRCGDPAAKHRITVNVDFAVADGGIDVLTQSGLFRVPVSDVEGKLAFFLFTPRGVVLQGFFEDVVAGSVQVTPMPGPRASFTTAPVFAPGEYELAFFIDSVPGGGLGPTRGDLAAFDNTVCDPTGVTVRVAVGCEDASVTLTNRHFILF
jgi:hypothetical protein